jgi:hypothetical protein
MSQYGPSYPPYPPQQAPLRAGGRVACIGCLGLVGFLAIVIAVVGANSPRSSTPAASTTTQAAPPAQAAQSALAAPPATTAAAKPAIVATFHGSGEQNTQKFTVTDTWQLAYAFDCTSFGFKGNFQVFEDGGVDFTGVDVNDLAMSKSANTWAYNDGGTHYLKINSECDWTVEVVDEG